MRLSIRSKKNIKARVLKFHTWILHEKIADLYFFSCPNYLPLWIYAPFKGTECNFVSYKNILEIIEARSFKLGQLIEDVE